MFVMKGVVFMRIKNKFKFIRALLILLIIISIAFCKATFSYKEIEYKVYTVEQGDTLWSIAEDIKLNNSYFKNKDIRDIISNLKNKNNLKNNNLYVNQELLIPNI